MPNDALRNLNNLLQQQLEELDSLSLRLPVHTVSGPQDTWITIDGKWCLNLSSDNYLGLADHPLVVEAAQNSLSECGVGAGASRDESGNHELYAVLEERLAQFLQTDASLLFTSEQTANLGLVTAIMAKGDMIIADGKADLSLLQAATLSGATVRTYPHGDMQKLSSLLATSERCRRTLVVSDGVASVDGELSPLPQICSVATQHNALVLIHDTHGIGVLGSGGRGTVEHFGVEMSSAILTGSLRTAFGSAGGFVCGPKPLIQFLQYHEKSRAFIGGLPPGIVGAVLAAVELVQSGDGLRKNLRKNMKMFVDGLHKHGLAIPHRETPICFIPLGETDAALRASRKLFEAGVFCTAVLPPAVPAGQAGLRVSLMATHTEEDIEEAVKVVTQALTTKKETQDRKR